MGNRWRYSQDFKRKALQLVAHENVSRTQISKDLETAAKVSSRFFTTIPICPIPLIISHLL